MADILRQVNIPFVATPEQKASRDRAKARMEEFNAMYSGDGERLSRYADFTAEYESCRDTDVYLNVTDYGRKIRSDDQQRHDIRMPYAHAITLKHAYRVAGRLPDIVCARRDSSAPERFRSDTIEKILYATYGDSKAQLQLSSGAHDASLLGAACFDVYYDVQRKMPHFRSVDPGSILVVPGVHDPHEFRRVYRFWQVSMASFRADYGERVFPGGETAKEIKSDTNDDMITMVERVDETTSALYAGGVEVEEPYAHNYGFVPYIIIPNLGPIREVWGYSDYEFYRHIAAYYEALISRQADLMRAVANGAYVDENSGQPPKSVKDGIREGGVIPARPNSKIYPVEVAQIPAFADTHMQAVRTAMDELGFTPPAAWGALGATSGSDRALQMAPQVELTSLKQINWSAGLERMNVMLLKMIEQRQTGSATFTGTHTRKYAQSAFSITLNAAATQALELFDENGNPILDEFGEIVTAPQTPEELINGDYATTVTWTQRLSRDDPEFVLSELNKYSQGAQSLYTTLTNLGVESPEDEMKLMEAEAERFPWQNQGMIAMLKQQFDQANQDTPSDPSAMDPLLGSGGGASGALNQDALARGLNGSSNAGGQVQGRVPGSYSGGA